MSNINKVILSGTVGRADYKQVGAKETGLLKFSLVTTEYIKTDDGFDQKPTWHNITVWGQTADRLAERVVKGVKLSLEGKLSNGSYEKDGIKHNTVEIVATNIDVQKFASDSDNPAKVADDLSGGANENDEVPF